MSSVDSVTLSAGLQAAVTALKQAAQAEQQAALALTQQAAQQLKQSTAAVTASRGNVVNLSA
ncbi:MAG: hypothetical protein WD407_14450 [Rhodospirillales bacterium]